jgi:hypothetical protein
MSVPNSYLFKNIYLNSNKQKATNFTTILLLSDAFVQNLGRSIQPYLDNEYILMRQAYYKFL